MLISEMPMLLTKTRLSSSYKYMQPKEIEPSRVVLNFGCGDNKLNYVLLPNIEALKYQAGVGGGLWIGEWLTGCPN